VEFIIGGIVVGSGREELGSRGKTETSSFWSETD